MGARMRMTNRHGYLALFAAKLVRLRHVLDIVNATLQTTYVSTNCTKFRHLSSLNFAPTDHELTTSNSGIARHLGPFHAHFCHRAVVTERRD